MARYRLRPANEADEEFIRTLRRQNYMHNAPILRIAGMTTQEVIEAMDAWTERSLAEMNKYDTVYTTIAETEEGEPVGYIIVLWPAHDDFSQLPQGYVFDLGVKREHRGTGCAAMLLQHAEDFVRKQGGLFIALNVNAQNGRAVAFYKKHGYLEEWKMMGKCLVRPEDLEPSEG
ncbi:MAG: hypothetical protein KatS3mg115_1710 [Candidatus Poribacteria bacterium]|nr:MAG: hypothetical protein KatS3mg115_1710 [Candidatus Poribacteria bacterium]